MSNLGFAWYSDVLIAAAAIGTIGVAISYLTTWGRGLFGFARQFRRREFSRAPNAESLASGLLTSAIAEPEPQSVALLRRAGMVNALVTRHQISNFAPPLVHDELGSVIRIVLGASHPPEGARLDTPTKDKLRDALVRSSLEKWLLDETASDEPVGWVKQSPNTEYNTIWKRPPVASINEGSQLSARCLFNLPVGLMAGPYALLIIDVVEQGVTSNVQDPSPLRFRFTLPSLHSLLHTMARTAIEEVGAVVFPLIFADYQPVLIGPNFEINFGDRTLSELVRLPQNFDRPDTAHDVPWVYINVPDGTNSRDVRELDEVIRQGLASMLRQSEFDGIEEDIAALPIP